MSPLAALGRTARPHQWTKNVLVLAPLLPGGQLLSWSAVAGAGIAFVSFCLAASGVYVLNDVLDAEADRAHPVKRGRPVASGDLSPRTAVASAVLFLVAALLMAVAARPELVLVVAVYEAIQVAYCLGMKHEPVLELASVASGFLLRALAGGVAGGIPLSQWFLMTAAFGSLFMAAGKRYAESRLGERTGMPVRRVVERYTSSYLRFVWTLSGTAVVVTYSLWAFEVGQRTNSTWPVASLVPFVLAILRFAIDVDAGVAEAPDRMVVRDRVLFLLGGVWVATLAAAVYT
ncbi:decaprenyl-phosphate phosphoribosyltransferase [Geodermatophilus dictyosporus]|uniref:Decaprenyl-phosphate phosphoribosyltransferase n=1 Tax=Geodermatophilus dictyosporus TaxID=1523247 RepID=A0A1I5LXY3_9ACTN|nr:decaprenyl-phosphate phosphoribosyltransferase [Geodermatophilus dictyosporus]SFP02218.1 decaprenyl-phosphate phosphoribosyltransferase [Geodermatophilus dictyosporus]